jgi:type III restriction enzyme
MITGSVRVDSRARKRRQISRPETLGSKLGCRSRSPRSRKKRKLGSAEALRDKDVQKQIAEEVRELVSPVQGTLEGVIEAHRIDRIVETVAETVADRTISIPQIVVLPKKHVTSTFEDFDLASLDTINMRPIEDGIIIEDLRTQARVYLARTLDDPREARPEDYLARYTKTR